MISLCADIHAGAYWKGRQRVDIYEAFNEVIDLSIDRKVEAFIIAGDLYDSSQPSSSTYATVFEALERLNSVRIPTYILAGNHDVQRTKDALEPIAPIKWEYIHTISDDYLLTHPYDIRFFPYRDVQPAYDTLGMAPFLGIGHAPVVGGMYGDTEVPVSTACLPKNLLDAAHHFFVGHIHTPQVISPNVYIPGSIVESNISDANQPRYLYLQSMLTAAPEKIELTRGWKFVKYELDYCTQKEQAKQQYKALTGGTKLDACDIVQVIIKIGMEDLGLINLDTLRKALSGYKIVDIPAPVIVRRTDVRLKTVQLETPRKQAVHEFIAATVEKSRVQDIIREAERIMQEVDGK